MEARFQLRKPENILQAMTRQLVTFFALDILRYKGEDLRGRPLMERKAILAQVLTANAHFSPVISVDGAGNALFDVIKAKKLEGIVAKKKTSKYVGRRDASWLEIINYSYADVQIAGYRKDQFGWLLRHENKPVGILALAVPPAHLKAFYGVAKSIVMGEDRNIVYLMPNHKGKGTFQELD